MQVLPSGLAPIAPTTPIVVVASLTLPGSATGADGDLPPSPSVSSHAKPPPARAGVGTVSFCDKRSSLSVTDVPQAEET